MIAQLTGKVARVADTQGFLVLDVQGVGYKVSVPVSVLVSLPPVGEPVTLVTHTQVREDDISLFGFLEDAELRVFQLLLTVSGVGPKVALALLSALTAADLAQAVASEDVRTLTRVPGVGARTAQRMVLELKEKLAALGFERKVDQNVRTGAVPAKTGNEALIEDVTAALLNLGYAKAEAQRASETGLETLLKTNNAPTFSDLLRAALGRLTGGGKG